MQVEPYPSWILKLIEEYEAAVDDDGAMDDGRLMEFAVRVALENIEKTSGGPFAALVVRGDGELVAVGYNEVIPRKDSTAHAEVMAIRRAEARLNTWTLQPHAGEVGTESRDAGEKTPAATLKLLTTCAPCLLCTGAIHWSGLRTVIAGARPDDANDLGFREGPPGFDPAIVLGQVGIEYRGDVRRDAALEVFRSYRGRIYNG
jgi:tRNA(Arg) A34 adenosine deaminase TadA